MAGLASETPDAPFRPAVPSVAPPGCEAEAVLGTSISIRRISAPERAVFLRPMECLDCGGQFFPRKVPSGLPRCSECGG